MKRRMPLHLHLYARTPYALQPSFIGLRLTLENDGPEAIRGPAPDGMCLETIDERGMPLMFVPAAPSPFPPEEIVLAPGERRSLEISSRACGRMEDAGLYRVKCHFQGAVSNVVEYRVLGERKSYVATMRPVADRTIEITLTNHGPAPIVWNEPCSAAGDLTVWGEGGSGLLEAVLVEGAGITQVAPGTPISMRFYIPNAPRGLKIGGRFSREPFTTQDVAFVLPA